MNLSNAQRRALMLLSDNPSSARCMGVREPTLQSLANMGLCVVKYPRYEPWLSIKGVAMYSRKKIS